MYKIEWDKETGGVILSISVTKDTIGVAPRPIFYEELNLLGLNKLGWTYPECEEPLMWGINKQYFYRGERLFSVKGANMYTMPTIELCKGVKPMELKPVDIKVMLSKTSDLMFALENEAIEFIRDTFITYSRANKTYEKADTNQLDFETLATKAEKKKKQKMTIVKQDCDSFDIIPLNIAKKEGKRVLLTTKIDRFIASFSGGKDSQVVLDLCTRAIPPDDFEVIYSDTGYELPSSLELYEKVKSDYNKKFPTLKFHLASNHESVLNYWDKIGTPSETHRWCCSIMKTTPLYRTLKVEGNKQAHTLTFDGVRAEESVRRRCYQRIGKGKHTYVYNAHPILLWNTIEIFLYLFRYQLPINPTYRNGKARVGCLICPFSTAWDDMISNFLYPDELSIFVNRLKKYSEQVEINDFDKFITERNWKLKALSDRNLTIPKVSIKTYDSSPNFVAEIKDARQEIKFWLPALCEYTIKEDDGDYKGELHFQKEVYSYNVQKIDNITYFKVYGRIENNLLYLLHRLIYKSAYCLNCEVCEVDCPTGALSIIPNININKNKCIHCHKCFNMHDRGCIVADCMRMINDSEKKLSSKIQGYKTFGLREVWIEEYFSKTETFWENNSLGTAQVDAMKAWLRDAGITDKKNVITPLGKVMNKIYKGNALVFWEIAFINLSYNSYIVNWVCTNINADQIYNKKIIKEEISNSDFVGSPSTVGNAAAAFVDMVKKSPIGNELLQGIVQKKDKIVRNAYNDLSLGAIAYSIYMYGTWRNITLLRVSDLYKPNENHGVYREFCISREILEKKLRTLSTEENRVLVAELNMGLDHITLREDLTPLEVLEQIILEK